MRALAVRPDSRELGVVERAPPAILEPGQVRLRVLDVGVCGTDREIAFFRYGTPPPGGNELILGHEALARVVETGPDVTRVGAGDLVVPMVRRPCPHEHCTPCREGRPDYCSTGDFREVGIRGMHGFAVEERVDDAVYLHVVPPELRPIGVLTGPLAIAEKAVEEIWRIQERLPWACRPEPERGSGYEARALVLGAGAVALLGAMKLRAEGFDTVVYSRSPETGFKARLAESIGAQFISAASVSLSRLHERIGRPPVVYEGAGASELSLEALEHLGPNSVFVFTGVPGRKAPMDLHGAQILRSLVLQSQIVFATLSASRGDYEAAIRDLAAFSRRWPDTLSSLITRRCGIEDAEEALKWRPDDVRNVITPCRDEAVAG